jgi:hypothetical protein
MRRPVVAAIAALIALGVGGQGTAAAQTRRAFVPLEEPASGPWVVVDVASVLAANGDEFSGGRYADVLVLGIDGPGRRNVFYRVLFTCAAAWIRPLAWMELDTEGRPSTALEPVDAVNPADHVVAADIRPLACGPLPLERPQGAAASTAAAVAYRAERLAPPGAANP